VGNLYLDGFNKRVAKMQQDALAQQAASKYAQVLNQQINSYYTQIDVSPSPVTPYINSNQLSSKAMPTKPPKYSQGQLVSYSGINGWVVQTITRFSVPIHYAISHPNSAMQIEVNEDELALTKGQSKTGPKKTEVKFESVVIADHKRRQILEAMEQINQQSLIFDTWGFCETIEKGRGVAMLFHGPPGTGKTLMAQAIANKLDRPLRIISTADVESSAPGESERNIRKHFTEATKDRAILLFDECDSPIFTRQAVGPIVGARINELLSQIEKFEGLTVFTTNRLGTLDEAVNRRLALKLEFDMPTQEERLAIWQRMVPKKAPIDDDVDWDKLAGVELTGGYIKNAILRAARSAATQDLPDKKKTIRMEHLVRALTLEAQSMVEFEEARQKQAGTYGVADVSR
jgi:SpoVK/Ycf46/Vps4 family AAA+-type ATPase